MSEEKITIEYNDAGLLRTIFTLPLTSSPTVPSTYAFSLPKAGSMLLQSVMRALSDHVGVSYVSLMGDMFDVGLAEQDVPETASKVFVDYGYCFGGFRAYPKTFEIPNLSRKKSILLVRDPRDMLVSHYFSMRSSHAKPGRVLATSRKSLPRREKALAMSADEYALDLAGYYVRQFDRYIEAIETTCAHFTIFRYEDVIFDKRSWVADICEALDWDVPARTINKIADRNDVVPRAEDEAKHIRQVTPGDAARKLRPETIERLSGTFARQLAYFGYEKAIAAN